MTEEEKTESSTDTEVADQVQSDAVESSATVESSDTTASNNVQEEDKGGVAADSQPEASQASSKPAEAKKKVKKPKLKPDIKVQKIGHKNVQSIKKGRGRKIEVIGHVISDKMDKTITVQIYRMVRHRRVGKYIKRSTKFKAHDEKNTARVGDQVLIHATRGISKTKYWKLSKILRSSERL